MEHTEIIKVTLVCSSLWLEC